MNSNCTRQSPVSVGPPAVTQMRALQHLVDEGAGVTGDGAQWQQRARDACARLLLSVDEIFAGDDQEAVSLRRAVRHVLEWALTGMAGLAEMLSTLKRLTRLHRQWLETLALVH